MKINLFLATLIAAALALVPSASAQWAGEGTPDGVGTDYNDANNWTNSIINNSFVDNDSTVTIDLTADAALTSFNFSFNNNDPAGGIGLTIGDGVGPTYTLTSSGAVTMTLSQLTTAQNTVTFGSDVNFALGGNMVFDRPIAGSGANPSITINGAIDLGDNGGTSRLNLLRGIVVVNGEISGTGTSGIRYGGESQSGSFTLTNANNSFTGNVVHGGWGSLVSNSSTAIANIGQNSALGAGDIITVNNQTLTLAGFSTQQVSNRTLNMGHSSAALAVDGNASLVLTGQIINNITVNGRVFLSSTYVNNQDANLISGTIDSGNANLGITVSRGLWRLTGENTVANATNITGGQLILDYATNQVLPTGNNMGVQGGEVTFLARSGAANTTNQTLGTLAVTQSVAGAQSRITLEANGSSGMNVTFGNITATSGTGGLFVDRGANTSFTSSTIFDSTDNRVRRVNDILTTGHGSGNNRANFILRDTGGVGFATQNQTTGEILRYTGATTLTESASNQNTNYVVTGDLTRTADLQYFTLELNATAGAVNLNMGGFAAPQTSVGRAVLYHGSHDASITNGTVGNAVFIHNYGTGKLTYGLTGASTLVFLGEGLTEYNQGGYNLGLFVGGGVARFTEAQNYTGGNMRLYNGGILELGADFTTGNANGDFTLGIGGSNGQVRWAGSGGFSAFGADRVINIGGQVTPNTYTWGQADFVSDRLMLGSRHSNATTILANNLIVNQYNQAIIETAAGVGTVAANARITGMISGLGGLTKTGDGVLELTANNTYTGTTRINEGTLLVNGSLSSASSVQIRAGATLGGSGSVGAISGAGTVAPGNSPGILTATQIDGSGGLDFAFEMTALNPTYDSAFASGNDVLRLTDSTPFLFDLTAANTITVDFSAMSLSLDDVIRGGFYADVDFFSAIQNATFAFTGTGGFGITVSTFQQDADFGFGTVNGYVTQFTVVPEPSTAVLCGLGVLLLCARRSRNARC